MASLVMLTTDQRIDRRILLEADSLEQAGWTVDIIAMPTEGAPMNDDPRVIRLGGGKEVRSTGSTLLAVYRRIRRKLPINSWLMRRLRALIWRFLVDQEGFFVGLFLPAALSRRADVYLAHDLPMLPVAVAAARIKGARIAYDSHELYAEQEFSAAERVRWSEVERRHIGAADAVITVNPSIAAELRRRYGLDKVTVVLNAEEPVDFPQRPDRLRERLGLRASDRVMLFQGGFSAGRSLETLIDAVSAIDDPSLHLVFLGEGQMRSALERRAGQAGTTDRVHFLDMVSQTELLSYSASADLGIIPYQSTCLNTHLCTPNKLFEFIAAGTPMLASDLPELRRLVADLGIGEVADLSTAQGIAAAVTGLFSEAARLGQYRERIRQIRHEISWTVEGAKFVAALEPLRPQVAG
jgi:glycosyltransferase involved in cell wall biosynthesis